MPFRSVRATLGAGAALLIALLALFTASDGLTGSASASVGSHRVGSAPRLPNGARRVGALASATEIPVDITLNPRDPAALSAFTQAVSTPGSSDYHHYLTVAQFRQQFAPTNAQIATVRAGLTAAGLDPGPASANGLLIEVRASAAMLAAAFKTSFDAVKLSSGRTGYANTSAPQLSSDLSGLVQGVVGLDNLVLPHALGLARDTQHHVGAAERPASETAQNSAVTPCAAATAVTDDYDGYTADQIAAAYGLTSLYSEGDTGTGQTVALMEFEKYATSDVVKYEDCYGIDGRTSTETSAPADVSEVNVDGGVGSSYTGGAAGSGEAALDIDQVVGLAPGANVAVYEAPNTYAGDIDGYTDMVDSSAEVISTSWGECEPYSGSSALEAESTIFEQAVAEGISVYAAAGDDGSADCGGTAAGATLAVDDPGSQPDVTSVGGTELPSTDGADSGTPDVAAQVVWNDSESGDGAGGGGTSIQWAMPSYQTGAAGSLGVINANSSPGTNCGGTSGSYCREVPDVSANADPNTPYPVYWDGSWNAMGGTSAAAPLWAALTAVANASTSCGSTAVGFANPVLYAIAGNATEYADDFTDITSGNNAYSPSGYSGTRYPAKVGYDMASGLGTPDAATLIPDMCSQVTDTTTTGTPTTTTTATTPPAGTPTSTTTTTGPTTTTPPATDTTPPTPPTPPTPTTPTTPTTPSDGSSTGPSGSTGANGAAAPRPVTPTPTTTSPQVTVTQPTAGQTSTKLTLSCPADGAHCAFTATLTMAETVKIRRRVDLGNATRAWTTLTTTVTKRVVMARGHLTFRAGKTGTLKLSLSAAGRKMLAKDRKLKLTLKVMSSGTTVRTRTVNFVVARQR